MARSLDWIILLILVVIAVTSARNLRRSDLTEADCTIDHDNHNVHLAKCLSFGHKFIKKYMKALNHGDKQFKFCETSQKFMDCLDPLVSRCPGISHVLHIHWRNVTSYITAVCTEKRTAAKDNLSCLADEYGSPLVSRCNRLHDFNIRQGTKDLCYFRRENLNCMDALITSQCGEATGEIAYHVMRLEAEKFVNSHQCHLPRVPTYRGFRYTDNGGKCSNFLERMKICVRDNIRRDTMISFRKENDLVITGDTTKKQIKNGCKRYKKYETCMRSIHEDCPIGPRHIYEVDDELRHYTLKMDFICQNRKQYLPNLRCYNNVHDMDYLEQCNENKWDDVDSYLRNVTSHQFHCEAHLDNVQKLKSELRNVRLCYGEVITNTCNATASTILSQFMALVFDDPAYLKFQYRADCDLHRQTTMVTLPPATRRTVAHDPTRHRPKHTRSHQSTKMVKHVTDNPSATNDVIDVVTKITDPPWRNEPKEPGKHAPSKASGSERFHPCVSLLTVTFVYTLYYVMT